MFYVEHQKNPSSMKNKKTDSQTDSHKNRHNLTMEILDLCIQRKLSQDDAVSSVVFAACKIMAVSRGIPLKRATQTVGMCLLESAEGFPDTTSKKRKKS